MLITCLRCPRGLHATTETMNLRVSRAHVYCVRANARGCPSTLHVCPKVRERERERERQGVRLTTFASWPPTQALSFDRPVDRVGYAPLQAESR